MIKELVYPQKYNSNSDLSRLLNQLSKPIKILIEVKHANMHFKLKICSLQNWSTIEDLPAELLFDIFTYLSVEDIVNNVRNTCQRWKEITEHEYFWNRVKFEPSSNMKPQEIMYYLGETPELKHVKFSSTSELKDVLEFMCNKCDCIESIVFGNKITLDGDKISKILQRYPCLEVFETFCPNFYMYLDNTKTLRKNDGNESMNSFPNTELPVTVKMLKLNANRLKYLYINNYITQSIVDLICNCENLINLFINNSCMYKSSDLDVGLVLARFRKLRSLQMRYFDSFKISNSVSYDELKFYNLVKIEIVCGGKTVQKTLNSLLRSCPNLKHLNLNGNGLKDEDISNIHLCKYLEYLDVSENYNLGDMFLLPLAEGCRELKYLDISQCREITDLFVLLLCQCSNLEILKIEGYQFTGEHFQLLPDLFPRLAELQVTNFLDLSVLNELSFKFRIVHCINYIENEEG